MGSFHTRDTERSSGRERAKKQSPKQEQIVQHDGIMCNRVQFPYQETFRQVLLFFFFFCDYRTKTGVNLLFFFRGLPCSCSDFISICVHRRTCTKRILCVLSSELFIIIQNKILLQHFQGKLKCQSIFYYISIFFSSLLRKAARKQNR